MMGVVTILQLILGPIFWDLGFRRSAGHILRYGPALRCLFGWYYTRRSLWHRGSLQPSDGDLHWNIYQWCAFREVGSHRGLDRKSDADLGRNDRWRSFSRQ